MTILAKLDPLPGTDQPPLPPDDIPAVRTAAQWLVAAAGAVGAALVAGLQIGDVGKLAEAPVQLAVAVLAFLVAISMVGLTIRRAGRVLVVSRTSISDLLREELRLRAESQEIEFGPGPDRVEADMPWVLDQIGGNREWLSPDHDSVGALYAAYETARRAADLATGPEGAGPEGAGPERAGPERAELEGARPDGATGGPDAQELNRRLTAVSAFARGELTRRAYRRLSDTVTGWPGCLFTAAVIGFAVAVSWPVSKPPAVGAAYRLDVLLTGEPAALRKAGLPVACLSGSRLTGVALDGTLTEPVVVTEAVTATVGGASSHCPAARFTVTPEVGLPMPYVTAK